MIMRIAGRHGRPLRLVTVTLAGVLAATAALAQQPPPGPPPRWEGSGGAGLSLTSGNSDTLSYNLTFDLTRTPKARNVMKWTALHLRGERDGDAIVNRTGLAFRDEYALTGRTFAFGQVEYLRDTFKLIDYFVAPTAGVGVKVVDTERTRWALDGGAGAVWEKNPGVDVRTSGAVTAGERLTHQLTATSAIKHAVAAVWKTDDFGDGLYTLSLGLATKVSERVQLSIDLLDTYKHRPATPATKKNDVALVTAITTKF